MIIRVELSTKHNTYYTHNTHMLNLDHFQIHNTCYTHVFFYVYTSVHNFLKLNFLGAFFSGFADVLHALVNPSLLKDEPLVVTAGPLNH